MKPIFFVLASMVFCLTEMQAQKFFTKTAVVSFDSKTPMENISATNKSGTCVLDAATGNVEFAVLIKGFQFEKALMQEHFNENYLESSKYPKAVFKGKLEGVNTSELTKNGKYKAKANGQLTLHGVTKPHSSDVVLEVKDGKIMSSSTFTITVADYDIKIPSLVKDNIAKVVQVSVTGNLEPLK